MKQAIKIAALAAVGVLALTAPSEAEFVTITYTGIAGNGGLPAPPWGFDAFGNNIAGDTYTANFTFDTSKGVLTTFPAENELTEPGIATGSFTIAGHTYDATGSFDATYIRTTSSVEVVFYDDPKANTGVVLYAPTINTATFSDNLDVPIPKLTLAPADVAASEEDVVLPLDSGALFATLNVETLKVSAPEPWTWTFVLAGLGAATSLMWRRRVAIRL